MISVKQRLRYVFPSECKRKSKKTFIDYNILTQTKRQNKNKVNVLEAQSGEKGGKKGGYVWMVAIACRYVIRLIAYHLPHKNHTTVILVYKFLEDASQWQSYYG